MTKTLDFSKGMFAWKERSLAFLLLAILFAAALPTLCRAQSGGSPAPSQNDMIEFNFQNVDINVFIKFISELTGKNFVVDERVQGEVSIISPAKITVQEAYEVFQSVLEVHGYTSVPSGGVIKVVPAMEARTKSVKTLIKEQAVSPSDQVVTQVIPLKYANAEEIKALFTPMVSKNSVILAYPQTDTVIVTDVYSNIRRLMQILGAIDVPGIGEEVSVIPLQYGSASEMENLLKTVFRPGRKGSRGDSEEAYRFRADTRTNSIVVMATEDEAERVRRLIGILDKETPTGKGRIHVYYLENAVAEDLAPILQELSGAKGQGGDAGTALVSKNVRVTADRSTNSLIIVADSDEYAVMQDIIRQLDIPRAMVYIESLLMEVQVNKNFELGVDWSVVGKTTIDGKESYIGGGFSDGGLDGTELVSPEGFAMGVVGGGIDIVTDLGTVTFPSIGAVAKAFEDDEDINILSTPQILTTDNEQAKIHVGRNIPYQTQSSTTDNTTYNSFEYRDVGISLTITPHISKDRYVRLEILQELTSIPGDADNADDRPTTLKRSINTTVIVKDRDTIVIGGLIDDTLSSTEGSVPCLGDIPGLSWLFKKVSRNNQKTNLFVFLTPRVIQTNEEAAEIYNQKQEVMDRLEGGVIKMYDEE